MRQRYLKQTDGLVGYLSRAATSTIFFVHGLGGSNNEEYWGRVGVLLDTDPRFLNSNIYFWTYPTTFMPKPSWWSLFTGYRLPDLDSLGRTLISAIPSSTLSQTNKLVIVGHSQGGVIGISLVKRILVNQQIDHLRGLIVLSSPFAAPLLARLYTLLSLKSNAQIGGLASTKRLRRDLFDCLSACRVRQVPTIYFEANQDTVVPFQDASEMFSLQRSITGPHTWMREVQGRAHDGYRLLSDTLADIIK
jgi:pimeloyl-ACP methyl ester carboxylesterase